MGARRITLRIEPPIPFGEVTLVPALLNRRPPADTSRAMAQALTDIEVRPAAAALNHLRHVFPGAPLSARLAALSGLINRWRQS